MNKFKVGDRVRYTGTCNDFIENKTGTIRHIDEYDVYFKYAVEFDKASDKFHECCGYVKPHTGWWCNENELELIEPEEKSFTVVIQSKGDCTTAKMLHGKQVIREAEVNRYHSDEYDEQTAIEAVVAKMFPLKAKPEPKPEPHIATGTKHKIQLIVCVDSHGTEFAIVNSVMRNEIYAVVNGRVANCVGQIIYDGYTTVESLNRLTGCEFAEIYNSEGIK